MEWVRLPTALRFDPRMAELRLRGELRAVVLWHFAWAHQALLESDGIVARASLPDLGGTEEDAAALVSCGLWTATESGWSFVASDLARWCPSVETLRARRARSKRGGEMSGVTRRNRSGRSDPSNRSEQSREEEIRSDQTSDARARGPAQVEPPQSSHPEPPKEPMHGKALGSPLEAVWRLPATHRPLVREVAPESTEDPATREAVGALRGGYARRWESETQTLWTAHNRNDREIREVAAWVVEQAASKGESPKAVAERWLDGFFTDEFSRKASFPWPLATKNPARFAAGKQKTKAEIIAEVDESLAYLRVREW